MQYKRSFSAADRFGVSGEIPSCSGLSVLDKLASICQGKETQWAVLWLIKTHSRVIGRIDETDQVADEGGTISIHQVESSQGDGTWTRHTGDRRMKVPLKTQLVFKWMMFRSHSDVTSSHRSTYKDLYHLNASLSVEIYNLPFWI